MLEPTTVRISAAARARSIRALRAAELLLNVTRQAEEQTSLPDDRARGAAARDLFQDALSRIELVALDEGALQLEQQQRVELAFGRQRERFLPGRVGRPEAFLACLQDRHHHTRALALGRRALRVHARRARQQVE